MIEPERRRRSAAGITEMRADHDPGTDAGKILEGRQALAQSDLVIAVLRRALFADIDAHENALASQAAKGELVD